MYQAATDCKNDTTMGENDDTQGENDDTQGENDDTQGWKYGTNMGSSAIQVYNV